VIVLVYTTVANTHLAQIKTPLQRMESTDQKPDSAPNVEETKHVLEAERVSTPEEERAVVRKIDMVVLPLMCFVFFLQYLDKQSLSYAAVRNGLIDNLIAMS